MPTVRCNAWPHHRMRCKVWAAGSVPWFVDLPGGPPAFHRMRPTVRICHPRSPPSPPLHSIKVTFKDEKDGSVTTVDAPLGVSLLELAHDNDVELEGPYAVLAGGDEEEWSRSLV